MSLFALLIVVFLLLVAITPSKPPMVKPQFDCICLQLGIHCQECHKAKLLGQSSYYCLKCQNLSQSNQNMDLALLHAAQ